MKFVQKELFSYSTELQLEITELARCHCILDTFKKLDEKRIKKNVIYWKFQVARTPRTPQI